MLTPRQRALLDFITAYIAEHRYAPSLREMADGIGAVSVGSTINLVKQLVERGYVKRMPDKHRAIEVVRP